MMFCVRDRGKAMCDVSRDWHCVMHRKSRVYECDAMCVYFLLQSAGTVCIPWLVLLQWMLVHSLGSCTQHTHINQL